MKLKGIKNKQDKTVLKVNGINKTFSESTYTEKNYYTNPRLKIESQFMYSKMV